MKKYYSGFARGTLGEILQASVVYNGKQEVVIISLPVSIGTTCFFYLDAHYKLEDSFQFIKDKSKTINSIKKLLAQYNLVLPRGYFRLESQLLIGKGMASSTADILASIYCLSNMFKMTLSPEDILDFIEEKAMDSVMYDGFCLFLSRKKTLFHQLNSNINFQVCYIDEDYIVDTECITCDKYYDFAINADTQQTIVTAFQENDITMIGRLATSSATNNQKNLPKQNFQLFIDNYKNVGSHGVIVSHTGSMIGFIFDANIGLNEKQRVENLLKTHHLAPKWVVSDNRYPCN